MFRPYRFTFFFGNLFFVSSQFVKKKQIQKSLSDPSKPYSNQNIVWKTNSKNVRGTELMVKCQKREGTGMCISIPIPSLQPAYIHFFFHLFIYSQPLRFASETMPLCVCDLYRVDFRGHCFLDRGCTASGVINSCSVRTEISTYPNSIGYISPIWLLFDQPCGRGAINWTDLCHWWSILSNRRRLPL